MEINWKKEPLTLEKRRTVVYEFQLYRADKVTPEQLQSGDVVRFKLGQTLGAAPSLDLDNVATSNGSVVTITSYGSSESSTPAIVQVKFAQGDIGSLSAGTYFGELILVDDGETSPADAAKPIMRGSVVVIDTLLGDIGLT